VIVLDTSGILGAIDVAQRDHAATRAVVEQDAGPFVLSPFVLAEVDFLLSTRVSVAAEIAFLHEVAERAYSLEPFDADDVAAARRLVERYQDLGIGLADASLVILAARHRTTRLLTLDERHFRVIRPLSGCAFRLLPRDR
jgi:uncharacterized protein